MAENCKNESCSAPGRPLWDPIENVQIRRWVEWAEHDGMSEEFLNNLRSWTQQQLLDLAEQIHHEKLLAEPDPKLYPETVNYAERYDMALRKRAEVKDMSFKQICLLTHRVDIEKIARNFRPEEITGRSWRDVRRSKGPLRRWL